MTRLFVALSALLLVLVGVAAAKDAGSRDFLAIQEQYQRDYPGSNFNVQIQQLFPTFAEATQGGTFRTERCISCHVPDIAVIGPEVAAQRLSQDFFKYAPNANQLAKDFHLTGTHPAYITADGGNSPPSISYAFYGASGFIPYAFTPNGLQTQVTGKLPGFLPSFLDPSKSTSKEGIDTVGCIVCHNGNRLALALDPQGNAHQNYIVNPEYSFTEGAALYYKNCAVCHGGIGEGGAGPPLSNQDRLGFFNEDYYYRCIEYGKTDFEHLGSIMPNWGAIAADYHYDPVRDHNAQPNKSRVLSEQEIQLLIQFIRHWENYTTLP
jgi:mono/diheme cytochrome c family protein